MEELINRLKEKLEQINNKGFTNNLIIFLIILIIFLIATNLFFSSRDIETTKVETPKRDDVIYDYNIELENRLKDILEKFSGVGEVDVMITLEDSIEKVPASNTTKTVKSTKETDSGGEVREINREDINTQIINNQSGGIMTIKEINPTIKGVIVVAEGAGDPLVLERLYEAVKTVLGINGNKVQIYSSK